MSSTEPPENTPGSAADRIRESAQQIWLAGLGAFSRVQQEGGKIFETLVKDGADLQKKSQQAAEDTASQAQERMSGFASEFSTRAAGQWSKFEGIFEEQVARVLRRLGVPSAAEIEALRERVAQLEALLGRRGSEGQGEAPADRGGDPR